MTKQHPLIKYADKLPQLNVTSWVDFKKRVEYGQAYEARVAATVMSREDGRSGTGNRFAFVTFSDPTGEFEAVIFSDALAHAIEHLEPGTNVIMSVKGKTKTVDKGGLIVLVQAQAIFALDDVLDRIAREGSEWRSRYRQHPEGEWPDGH